MNRNIASLLLKKNMFSFFSYGIELPSFAAEIFHKTSNARFFVCVLFFFIARPEQLHWPRTDAKAHYYFANELVLIMIVVSGREEETISHYLFILLCNSKNHLFIFVYKMQLTMP